MSGESEELAPSSGEVESPADSTAAREDVSASAQSDATQEATVLRTRVKTVVSWEAPLPPPALLEQYDQIVPGLASDIAKQARIEADHVRTLDTAGLKAAVGYRTPRPVDGVRSGTRNSRGFSPCDHEGRHLGSRHRLDDHGHHRRRVRSGGSQEVRQRKSKRKEFRPTIATLTGIILSRRHANLIVRIQARGLSWINVCVGSSLVGWRLG